MQDLQQSALQQDVLDKFHSSKNLNIDFDKQVVKQRVKAQKDKQDEAFLAEQSQSATAASRSARDSKGRVLGGIVNNISQGLNLFDVGQFKTEENFDHLKVVPIVDENELLHKDTSLQIQQREKYTLDNPFQGSLKDFLEGSALQNLEEQLDVDADDDLKDFLNVESDVLLQINKYDGLNAKHKLQKLKPPTDVLETKQKLPVTLKELEIMESTIGNLVTIVCGETGSGKSTQIPQFLYETGMTAFGMVAVTQPRRLAAISLAQRVAEETGTKLGDLIGYQVRFEASRFTEHTKIKFMTDGILLNEMMTDFLLTKYSVIVLDEAHERKINTDLLIGLLSRVIRIRAKLSLKERAAEGSSKPYKMHPLRLIIMSATLRISDFTENKYLFPEDKLNTILVEARMFPVKTYYNRTTPEDYLASCLAKTESIHTKLPPGGVLVFLTGEEEIKDFCARLAHRFEELKYERNSSFFEVKEEDFPEEDYELREVGEEDQDDKFEDKHAKPLPIFKEDLKELNRAQKRKEKNQARSAVAVEDYVIYPLFTKLPLEEQQKIFHHLDPKKRLIVVSTNVAETSLTIPNIKYVVDSGKEKRKVYNAQMSLGRFEIDWVSQSSAKQREGRAGRTSSGHCYRIYSQAAFNKFQAFSDPEILKEPLDSSVLALKTIGIQDIAKFPFVTRPDPKTIERAETELQLISAVDKDNRVTQIGTSLSQLPIKPRHGKMLLMARKARILGYGILLVTALSCEEMFDSRELKQKLNEADFESMTPKEAKKLKQQLLTEHKKKYQGLVCDKSDLITETNIMGTFVSFLMGLQSSESFDLNKSIMSFCKEKSLLFKSMREAYSLILHLLQIVETIVTAEEEKLALRAELQVYKVPKRDAETVLTEVIVAAMIDKVARRIRYIEEGREKQAFETTEHELRAQVHPSSFVFSRKPEFLIYNEVIENEKGKIFLARVTEIEDSSLLPKYDTSTAQRIEYLRDPPPRYLSTKDRMFCFAKCTFGPKLWEIPLTLLEMQEESRARYFHFAVHLLKGQVITSFSVLASRLVVKVDPVPAVEPKALEPLVSFLQEHRADRRARLRQFLHGKLASAFKATVLALLSPKDQAKVEKLWPRIMMLEEPVSAVHA